MSLQMVWKEAACIAVPVLIFLFPVPAGLSADAWNLFAITEEQSVPYFSGRGMSTR